MSAMRICSISNVLRLRAALFAGCVLAAILPLVADAQAATDCVAFFDAENIPAGFGSPANAFSQGTALLLRASCEHDEVRLYAGNVENPTTDTAIWRQGYLWRGEWEPFSFDTQRTYNGWIFGATQHLLKADNAAMHEGIYFLGFVCVRYNGAWRCGCRDSACAQSNWMLQKVELSYVPSDDISPTSGAKNPDNVKQTLFSHSNDARSKRGLSTLSWDSGLAAIARGHSRDMAERTFFEHVNPDGCDSSCRVEQASYAYSAVAENLFFEVDSEGIDAVAVADNALANWLDSTAHRRNLLSVEMTHTGIGVVQAGNTVYVTALYAAPR